MARQYIIGGLLPSFINETAARQYAVGGVFLQDTTIAAATSLIFNPSPFQPFLVR